MRAISVRRAFALCASLLSLGLLPGTAAATSTQVEVAAAIDKAVEYTRSQQEAATGAMPGFGGDWVATALAAAGVDAAGVHGPTAGDPSFQDYLLGEYTLPTWDEDPPGGTVTDYARSTLVAHAAGLDPARLSASSNQPAQLAGRWNPATGSFGEPSTNNAVFGILALKTTPLPGWALQPVVSFLRRNQHDDGGWVFPASPTPAAQAEPSDPEMTGAAIAALCEAGVPAYDPAVAAALSHLQSLLVNGTGGIQYIFGPPNSDTNAWVVSGLSACGIDPQSSEWTTPGGKTPIDFLLSLQVPSGPEAGGFGYSDASAAGLYSTQDALRAIAGAVFTAAPQSTRSLPMVATGTPVPHLLAIELAPGNVRMCKVTAPAEAPLTQVLAAAKATSYPAGCLTSFSVSGGQVESINGVAPENQGQAWLLRLDRGSSSVAADQPVGFGEVISLRLGEDPLTAVGPVGPRGSTGSPGHAGAQGPAGSPGKPGRKGSKGRPGHAAKRSCKARRRQSAKRRGRCGARHPRGNSRAHRGGSAAP